MKEIKHGFLGKFKTYKKVGLKEVPNLTEEERRAAINEKIKPWKYDPEKIKPKYGFQVMEGEGPIEPSPTPSPTPSATITPTPTLTPTITPSPSPITYFLLTAESDILQTAEGDNIEWFIPAPTPTPTPTISPSSTLTPTPTPSVPLFDTDAALYLADVISAGGSVDATMSAATDTLFTSLKSNNLYDKLNVFYPMLGATSGSTALMGKRASGTTYDITWSNVGSITFDYSGVTGNGSTTDGDTNFNGYNEISTAVGAASHLSLFVGTDTASSGAEMGTRVSGNWIFAVDFGGTYYGWHYTQGGLSELSFSNANSIGMYVQTRTSTTSLKAFKDGVEQQERTYTESNTIPNSTLKILSDGSAYSDRRIQFASSGEGLNDTEAQTLTTIINDFQTALSRNPI